MRSLLLAVVVLCAVLVTSSALAVERPLVAVLDFNGAQAKLSGAEIRALTRSTRKLALEFLGERYDIITRESLIDLLKSHGKTLEKCQGECETETGRLIGAELVITGEVSEVFGAYRLDLRAHRTDPPKLLAAEEIDEIVERERLPSAVRESSRSLFEEVLRQRGWRVPQPSVTKTETTTRQRRSKQGRSPLTGFIRIEPGSFMMGSPPSESGRDADEGPMHRVTIGRRFSLQSTEVTQAQWQALMGTNPSRYSSCGDKCPVENVSWWGAIAYLNALSAREGMRPCYQLSGCSGRPGDGRYRCSHVKVSAPGQSPLLCEGYRLPTEAEWKYAARAGTTGALYGPLDEIAWYERNSGGKTHPVGLKVPSPWGLYDMLGNVYEWTWDWYGSYRAAAAQDPTGPTRGSGRVALGGGWLLSAQVMRVDGRCRVPPDLRKRLLGFRPARTLPWATRFVRPLDSGGRLLNPSGVYWVWCPQNPYSSSAACASAAAFSRTGSSFT